MSRIKNGEKPQYMGSAINRCSVYRYSVMSIITSHNMKTGIIFSICRNSRQHLRIVQRVSITQNLWQVVHHLKIPVHCTILRCPEIFSVVISHDNNRVE